ncbi:MAG: CoA transferase [Burkholderiaceae bacterium]
MPHDSPNDTPAASPAASLAEFPAHAPRPPQAPLPLAGIRVVDFSHFIAGPFATMMLADMGADVIKIESPGRGDEFRHFAPVPEQTPTQGAPFMWSNRNKRSVALNLKTPEGADAARALIASADVLCENFSAGVMEKFGLGYEQLRDAYPRLVYCAVSAYGRSGPFSDRLGFDPIAQAESGFVSMNGYPDREGVRATSPIVDIGTAMMACNAILGALMARHSTRRGQRIDLALFDTAVTMTGFAAMQNLYTGRDAPRTGNVSTDTCPTGVFRSADQPFFLICGTDDMFARLARSVIDRPELAADPRYATRASRLRERDALFELLGGLFATQPWRHWQARMRAASIPCGVVRSVGEALRSDEAREREIVSRVEHPALGWVPNIRLPIRYSATPLADPRPAPALGGQTAEILKELAGYDDTQIAALARSGVISL